jgi:tetratricopeptide (TPR) repeat protein
MQKPYHRTLLLLTLTFLSAPLLTAQAAAPATPQPTQTIPGLGTLTFPTSTTNPQAQTAFLRGLLLLHVFEYDDAAHAFQQAEQLDPAFAMAYWGEAMTHNHPVWNEVDPAAGNAALAKLAPTPADRTARVQDPRQKAYLEAVEILYQPTGTKAQHDVQYATAMQSLAQAYPADDEAQLFYALALLGRSEGIRDVPTYLQAAAISQAAFERNPQHPGAAHYWIHGMDDPDHAAQALPAARALSKIAPDAAHALHMCSHIFMALGMWDDVVEANLQAIRVGDAQDHAANRPILTCGHYVLWLQYGYYQQGRPHDGDQLFTACQTTAKAYLAWIDARPDAQSSARPIPDVLTPNPQANVQSYPQPTLPQHPQDTTQAAVKSYPQTPNPSSPQPNSATASQPTATASRHQRLANRANSGLILLRGTAIIETAQSQGSIVDTTIDTTGLGPTAGWNTFATGYAAALRHDLPTLEAALDTLRRTGQDYRNQPNVDPESVSYLSILTDLAGALLSAASGNKPSAIAQAQRAADTYDTMAFDFGPPATLLPPNELLGDLLLEDDQPQLARDAYTASLRRAPNRTLSLLGLARAQEAADDPVSAHATWKLLAAVLHNAEPNNPIAAEARSHLNTAAK